MQEIKRGAAYVGTVCWSVCIVNSNPTTIYTLTFCPPSEIFHSFLSSADFFQNQLFRKNLSGIPSECQTDWIQIRPTILSGLIWVQSVCKDYDQMTLVDKELKVSNMHTVFNLM